MSRGPGNRGDRAGRMGRAMERARNGRQAWRTRLAVVLACAVSTLAVASPGAAAAPADPTAAFTVGNYPVEGRAADAAGAKNQAIADGQTAAFRSLLKRLVPVTLHARLRRMKQVKASDYLDGVKVRKERNSATEYLANLDFTFQPDSVRTLLSREGLPFVEQQAPQIVIVPFWRVQAKPGANPMIEDARGAIAWTEAWKGLDLEHALAPARLETAKKEIHPDTLKALAAGDRAGLRILAQEYKAERIVAAIMDADDATQRLNVTLIGDDAVGGFSLIRAYRADRSDAAYSVELAAVIALGVLEGRWKSVAPRRGPAESSWSSSEPAVVQASRGGGNSGPDQGLQPQGAGDTVQLNVEFRGMGEWQDLSRRLAATPGIQDLDVAGLSARGARIAVRYPGGPERLAEAIGRQGMALRNVGGTWVLTAQ